MHAVPFDRTRRALLQRSVDVAGIALVTVTFGNATPAAAKAAKSEFHYQDRRHDGKSCGDCKFFSPDNPKGDVGTCSIVEGVVSREGWCQAFASKLLA